MERPVSSARLHIAHVHGLHRPRLTQVFANVLNLKDRSTPRPSCVSDHLLPMRPSSSLLRAASSEPAENCGCDAIVAVRENGRRAAEVGVRTARGSIDRLVSPDDGFMLVCLSFVRSSPSYYSCIVAPPIPTINCQGSQGLEVQGSYMIAGVTFLLQMSASPVANHQFQQPRRVAGRQARELMQLPVDINGNP